MLIDGAMRKARPTLFASLIIAFVSRTGAPDDALLEGELGAKNALVNASFEEGDRGWLFGGDRDIQLKTIQGDRRSPQLRDFVREARTGKWALRLSPGIAIMQEFSLKGAKCSEIALGVSARGRGRSVGEVALWAANGARLGKFTITGPKSYETLSRSVTLPKMVAESLRVVLRAVEGSIVVDDVRALPLTETEGGDSAAAIDDISDMEKQAARAYETQMKELKDAQWERRNARVGSAQDQMARELYCRLTVPKDAPGPIALELDTQTGGTVKIDLDGWPVPDKKSIRFGCDGYWIGALPNVQFGPPGSDAQVRPGETSSWVRIMPPIVPDLSNAVTFRGRSGEAPAKAMDFVMELALRPEEKAVFFRKRCKKSGECYIVLFPGRMPASLFAGRVFDEQHFADEARRAMEALGEPKYGKRPELFQVASSFSGSLSAMGRELFESWVQMFYDLGLNTISVGKEGQNLARQKGLRLRQRAPLPGSARAEWLLNCDWQEFEEQCKVGWQKLLAAKTLDPSRPVFKSFGNETNSPSLRFIVRDAQAQEWFRQFLREQGSQPRDFGAKEWSEVRPCARYEYLDALERNKKYSKDHGEFERMEEDEKESEKERKETGAEEAKGDFDETYQPLPYDDLACAKLYYWTNRFRVHTLKQSYDRAASIIFRTKPPRLKLDVCTGYFSDGWMHEGGGNLFEEAVGSGNDLLNIIDPNGHCTSMGASNLIYWAQLHGWTTDMLRASGKGERFVPVHDGLVPSWRDPLTLEYTTFMKLAHGTKSLFYFPYGPYPYHILDGPFTGRPWFFKQIRRLNYMLGDVEELLLPGVIPRAQIAFIYNQTADIWALLKRNRESGPFGAMGVYKKELNEKRGVWLALRHEHYACDILSDWDLAKGMLDHYKVAYLPGSLGPHLDRAGATALREWVEKGGILWTDCHTGLLDEYNQPLEAFSEMIGIRESEVLFDDRSRTEKGEQPNFDEIVGFPGGSPVWVVDKKAGIEVGAGAKVMARFGDGEPAVVEAERGKGRVFYVAAYPGVSYQSRCTFNSRDEDRERRKLRKEDREKYDELRRAMKLPPLPNRYPEAERSLVTIAARAADLDRWVVLSQPVIHWGYLVSKKGICIPLANFLHVAQEQVEASVKVAREVASVRSTIHGPLAFTEEGDRVKFALPLERCDFVCVQYRE